MKQLFLLAVLALSAELSFAAVYKCAGDGGRIAYQSTPCTPGQQGSTVAVEPNVRMSAEPKSAAASAAPALPAATSQRGKTCVGKELRIHFANMPLVATLQVVADFSGNTLQADPSISGSGAFHYECIPWDTVLQDIASRHNVLIKVEGRTIVVQRR